MDLLSVIRRWHFRQKIPIREIKRRTGLSRNTILALGARPVWSAGSRREAPIARKGVETGIEPHLPCRRVMMFDQRLGIIDQDFSRNAAEP